MRMNNYCIYTQSYHILLKISIIYIISGIDAAGKIGQRSDCTSLSKSSNKNGVLLTEKNDPINMGTYNYVGPSDAEGYIQFDVESFYVDGNTPNAGTGRHAENAKAKVTMDKFLFINKDAQTRYDTYAIQFGLRKVTADYQKNHQPW